MLKSSFEHLFTTVITHLIDTPVDRKIHNSFVLDAVRHPVHNAIKRNNKASASEFHIILTTHTDTHTHTHHTHTETSMYTQTQKIQTHIHTQTLSHTHTTHRYKTNKTHSDMFL